MNTDDIIKAVGAAIAEAFGISDELQLLQIILSMSDEGILKIADIITTEKDDKRKIKRVQTEVQKDIHTQKTMKAEFGAKLQYLQSLRQGHVIKSMRQNGDPGSIDSTAGMKLNKKQRKMLPEKKQGGGGFDMNTMMLAGNLTMLGIAQIVSAIQLGKTLRKYIDMLTNLANIAYASNMAKFAKENEQNNPMANQVKFDKIVGFNYGLT